MEEGTKHKKTIFIGGISDDTDEMTIYQAFSTFGDIIEVQLPPPATQHHQHPNPNDPKHRGFGFVTFASSADAHDAIDNMDMNELKGKVLKVNLARPATTVTLNPQANKAIWESEEWLKEHVKPLAQAGGVQSRFGGSNSKEAETEEQTTEANDAMEE